MSDFFERRYRQFKTTITELLNGNDLRCQKRLASKKLVVELNDDQVVSENASFSRIQELLISYQTSNKASHTAIMYDGAFPVSGSAWITLEDLVQCQNHCFFCSVLISSQNGRKCHSI